jgi:hypothetical protein
LTLVYEYLVNETLPTRVIGFRVELRRRHLGNHVGGAVRTKPEAAEVKRPALHVRQKFIAVEVIDADGRDTPSVAECAFAISPCRQLGGVLLKFRVVTVDIRVLAERLGKVIA